MRAGTLIKVGVVLLLAGLTVATFKLAGSGRGGRAARRPGMGEVADFALVDQGGRPVGRADLAGQVWVADFIFTRCGSTCPRMTAAMAEIGRELGAHPGIRLVSITVDPEHDTPAVLAEYAGRHGAERERWLFLTGERPAIERLARESFHLAAGEGDAAAGGESFLHSTRLVLVDREGWIRGTYDGTDAARVRALRADLEALLAEEPSRKPS